MEGYIISPGPGIVDAIEIIDELSRSAHTLLRVFAVYDLHTIPVGSLMLMLMRIIYCYFMALSYQAQGQLLSTLLKAAIAIGYSAGAEYTNGQLWRRVADNAII
jgi:hypothetical protein